MYMYKTDKASGALQKLQQHKKLQLLLQMLDWGWKQTFLLLPSLQKKKKISALENILPFAWGDKVIKVIIDPSLDAKTFCQNLHLSATTWKPPDTDHGYITVF